MKEIKFSLKVYCECGNTPDITMPWYNWPEKQNFFCSKCNNEYILSVNKKGEDMPSKADLGGDFKTGKTWKG